MLGVMLRAEELLPHGVFVARSPVPDAVRMPDNDWRPSGEGVSRGGSIEGWV